MARITSKQAKEMNEAYAKVHQNLQERVDLNKLDLSKSNGGMSDEDYNALSYSDRERIRRRTNVNNMNTTAKEVNLDKKTGEKVTIEKGEVTDRKSSANNNNQQSTQSNNNNQQSNNNQSSGNNADAPKGGGSYKFKPDEAKALGDKLRSQSGDKVQSNNQTSQGSGQPQGGQTQSGAQQPQSGVNRSQTVEKEKDGNTTTTRTTTRTSADNSTPEGAAAVKDFKANREARLNRLRSGGGLRPDGQGPSTGGTPPSTQGGTQKPVAQNNNQAAQKPGALGRLGSLAGRAANAARNAAGGIKQVATSTASNIKKGAQAVAGGIRQGAQAVSGALANKGPIQGRASGPQRRAQQAVQRTQQAQPAQQSQPAQQQAQPAQQQAKPALSNNSPAAKAGIPLDMRQAAADKNAKFQAARKSGNMAQYRKENPKLSGADRAKAMARERIAAKKAAPAKPVQKKVTSVMDMEGYDPMENLFDDTVQFLVSEGHAKDKSEAISIMSESEFIDAFNQELNE